ncbi:MAG: hypothetical protein KVP17_005152 [Porospora cf. gigantea B]|uniref:uncharacterized protein n=1 Tax=Porospora cf. gigantea B TaxID=2853592 RepID=UPI003571DE9E|nr:MAG: hypothetical protein KVP17_005152 [Porospora cf. gigantea B]
MRCLLSALIVICCSILFCVRFWSRTTHPEILPVLPVCDSSQGYLTDSGLNYPGGLNHRDAELGTYVKTAGHLRMSLIDFRPKFDGPKHTGKKNQCQLYWSDLKDMDSIILSGVDKCGEIERTIHCRLNVSHFANVDPANVTALPTVRNRYSLFAPKESKETAPPCFQVAATIKWSPFIEGMARRLLDVIGPNPVIVQLRLGDKRKRVPNKKQKLTNAQLCDPKFVMKALQRHGVLPESSLYITTNPDEKIDYEAFRQVGYSVVTPEVFEPFKKHAILTNNIAQFAVESAAARAPGVWWVRTDKGSNAHHRVIALHQEPVDDED